LARAGSSHRRNESAEGQRRGGRRYESTGKQESVDSKIEMDILDALDEIKSLNAKNAKLDPEQGKFVANQFDGRGT